jgi:hypothetical protein
MALLITPTGHLRTVSPHNHRNFTAQEIDDLLGGHPVCIHLQRGERRLWINEDGNLLRLPRNPLATLLARSVIPPGTSIVGPALLMTKHEAGV